MLAFPVSGELINDFVDFVGVLVTLDVHLFHEEVVDLYLRTYLLPRYLRDHLVRCLLIVGEVVAVPVFDELFQVLRRDTLLELDCF